MPFRISQVWIFLNLQQGFRESAVRLVHPDESFIVRQTFDLNTAAFEDRPNWANAAARPGAEDKACQFAGPAGTHGVSSDSIEPSQPLHAILRRMLQQKKRDARHVLRDVAQLPLAATPHWSKVRTFLLRIVTFARTKLFKLQRHWRSDPRRSSLGKNANAGVVVRIRARRSPGVVRRVVRDSFETFRAQLTDHPFAKLRIALDDLTRHVWFDRRHVRRQKQSRTKRALLMNVVDDLRAPNVVNLVHGELRLDLCERVPVAVVIVTGVFVIELGRIGAFERRTE